MIEHDIVTLTAALLVQGGAASDMPQAVSDAIALRAEVVRQLRAPEPPPHHDLMPPERCFACGAPIEVDDREGFKTGRCEKCGNVSRFGPRD